MAKLVVNPTSSSRREIVLPKTLLSIGRDPSNDLVLPDAMVSRRHAVIEFRGNQFYLRDCNSSNGSLVNGDRVSERSLRDGDLVAIGTARLLFRDDVDVEDVGAKVVPHPSSPRMNCPSCGSDYRKGDLFCRQCGTQLAPSVPPRVVCTACGTSVPLPARFCNACGTPLAKDVLDITRPRQTGEPEPPPELAHAAEAGAAGPVEVPAEGDSAPASAEPRVVTSDPPAAPVERPNRSSAAVEPALPASAPAPEVPRSPAPVHVVTPAPPPPALQPASVAVPMAFAVAADPAASKPASGATALPAAAERSWRTPSPVPRLERARPTSPTVRLGGFGRRLVAGLVDSVIVSLSMLLLLSPVFLYWRTRVGPSTLDDVQFVPILLSLVLALLVLVLGGAYYVFFWGVRGATPGEQLLDLAVEGEDGTSPIGVPRAVGRLLGYLLSAAILGIGFLMIIATGNGLHDRIAGTRVVRRRAA
jgi:uncharacterized RDD family membrane protein YckC